MTSPDGLFTIFFPPGALPVDTEITMEPIGPADWDVDTPSNFELLGEVYRVRPAIALSGTAWAILQIPVVPDYLRTADGADVMTAHFVYTGEKVRPAPSTRTIYLADGRAVMVARILDIGDHWTGELVPGVGRELVQLAVHLDAEAGPHDTGAEWRWTAGSIQADPALSVLSRETRVAVAHFAAAPTVVPIEDMGVAQTWDATWDDDLGLHVWEALGLHPDTRSETVVTFENRMPFLLEVGAPVDPLSDPLPGWTCPSAGADEGTLFIGVDVVTGASDGATVIGAVREIGPASCR